MLPYNYYLFRPILLVILLLTSCFPYHQLNIKRNALKSNQWIKYKQVLKKVHTYQVYGLLTYLSSKQKLSVRFKWQQINPNHYILLIINALGTTELQLKYKNNLAQIIDNKGNHYISNDVEKLIFQITGINLPINNLPQWLIGLPGAAIDYQIDDNCLLQEIHYKQNSKQWHIIYKAYNNKEKNQDLQLPLNFELQEGSIKIYLKIYRWILPS